MLKTAMVLEYLFQRSISRLLGCFFQFLYHQLAFLYDGVAALVSNGKWKDWTYTSSHFIEGQPVLELGFGPGHLQKYLIEKGIKVFGLDESSFMGRLAAKKLRHLNRAGVRTGLCRGVAQKLPYKSNSFSTIVATFPTPYILERETIQECWRVLQPQGRLVILLGVKHGGNSLYERFLRWLFNVTHQSIEDSRGGEIWKTHYACNGFRVEQFWHPFDEDHLWFIVAEKLQTPFANV